jgi:hypothetical protein
MRTSSFLVGAALLAVALAPFSRVGAQEGGGTRTVYVSVLDKRGPVADLTAAEFAIKEDGKPREIVKVELASSPLQVALIVDDDDQGALALRAALTAAVKKLAGRAEIALVTTRGGPIVRQDFSSDTAALLAAIDALPGVNPGLAYLPNGLLDLSQALGKRNAARPVIIGIASPGLTVNTTEDGPDGRVPATKDIGALVNPSSPAPALVLDSMRRTHTLFYMLHLDTYTARSVDNQPPEYHFSWPLDAPTQSGGRTERIVTAQGLTGAMDRVADELLGQYAVTYRSGEGTGDALVVDMKRKGLTVHAPQRMY